MTQEHLSALDLVYTGVNEDHRTAIQEFEDEPISQDMLVAQAGQLSHGDFAGRMRQYGVSGGAAENLSAGSDTVAEAVARWKASPGHNSNLLMPGARRIGLARADSDSRYGRYWALVLSQ